MTAQGGTPDELGRRIFEDLVELESKIGNEGIGARKSGGRNSTQIIRSLTQAMLEDPNMSVEVLGAEHSLRRHLSKALSYFQRPELQRAMAEGGPLVELAVMMNKDLREDSTGSAADEYFEFERANDSFGRAAALRANRGDVPRTLFGDSRGL